MQIKLHVLDVPKQAKLCGWTKRHKLVEMFVVGKWRSVGFFTDKQILTLKHETAARERILANGGPSFKSVPLTFVTLQSTQNESL
jgi:hypothetical protein